MSQAVELMTEEDRNRSFFWLASMAHAGHQRNAGELRAFLRRLDALSETHVLVSRETLEQLISADGCCAMPMGEEFDAAIRTAEGLLANNKGFKR